MAEIWDEVATAREEGRHELVLSGADISKRIEISGLDPNIYSITHLNFLEISKTGSLTSVSESIGKLTSLTNLVLHSNKLKALPKSIGRLTKLKVLDVSSNQLEMLPASITELSALTTLNAASNVLTEIPKLQSNACMLVLDLSHNQLMAFPDICYPELSRLSEVKLNGNRITAIPAEISNLVGLKTFDLRANAVTCVPRQLSQCTKLKDVHLQGNKLSDRRLLKLVEGGAKSGIKPVLDYIRQHCPLVGEDHNSAASGGKKGKSKGKGRKADPEPVKEEKDILTDEIQVTRDSESTPVVTATNSIMDVRPHLICCILRNVQMDSDSFRKFIQLQTQLHDTVCEKRVLATIATHDLDKVAPGGLTYDGRPPSDIKLQPLGRIGVFSAHDLFQQLHKEAETVRKEKKRNTFSGIHKFLHLLEGKQFYPCLLDSSGSVISLPPITNGDLTKISETTKSILVEVTSSSSQLAARKVADTLLLGALRLGIGAKILKEESEKEGEAISRKVVQVEQVRVVDVEGKLRAVYPSREDLQITGGESITVTRPA